MSAMAPSFISKPRTHDPVNSGQTNENTASVYIASFTPSLKSTCSAPAVDYVAHLCVQTDGITRHRGPVIGLISVVSIAICSQIQSRTPDKSQTHTPCSVEAYHDLQNCFSVHVGGAVRMERHSTHSVPDAWPRHGRQPH